MAGTQMAATTYAIWTSSVALLRSVGVLSPTVYIEVLALPEGTEKSSFSSPPFTIIYAREIFKEQEARVDKEVTPLSNISYLCPN